MVDPRCLFLALFALTAPLVPCAETAGDGWLGVSLTEGDRGPRIVEVVPDSPAAKAGLRADDEFVSVDGVATPDLDTVIAQLQTKNSGDRVRLQVRRGEKTVTVAVTLSERPVADGAPPAAATGEGEAGKPYAGVALEEDGDGIRVVRVLPDSPAAAAGVLAGDVLQMVGSRRVADLATLDAMLQRARPGQQVPLRVVRGGSEVQLRLTLGTAPAAATPAPQLPPEVFVADPLRALAAARGAGRPVLLVFGATWCAACHAQRRALAQARLAGYETIWVDAEQHGKLADEYGVQSLPHLFVLGADGRPILSREGYQPVANLEAMLAQAAPAAAAERDSQPVDAAADRLGSLRRELRELRREVAELREALRKRVDGRR